MPRTASHILCQDIAGSGGANIVIAFVLNLVCVCIYGVTPKQRVTKGLWAEQL